MSDFVVDSSVWIASLKEDDPWHSQALPFIQEFGKGMHRAFLPRIVLVEVCARLGLMFGPAFAVAAMARFEQWHRLGWLVLHDLDEARTAMAFDAALRYRLRGADAIVAALADEMQSPILAFDRRILAGHPRAQGGL